MTDKEQEAKTAEETEKTEKTAEEEEFEKRFGGLQKKPLPMNGILQQRMGKGKRFDSADWAQNLNKQKGRGGPTARLGGAPRPAIANKNLAHLQH
eukprot:CAMPEP_0174256912 /NCGR_PEP_ID=MMETSP0439-20130205/6114_1 /TAXON_ID=0 /ORGANISM="Stereomyxa ramosa, Strain Chinc5" /LENGTH=94 /DNA_ID=CAMNT_0015339763 /DNA_START=27 /DNA_END=311 /DNA_ORIENTATION=-